MRTQDKRAVFLKEYSLALALTAAAFQLLSFPLTLHAAKPLKATATDEDKDKAKAACEQLLKDQCGQNGTYSADEFLLSTRDKVKLDKKTQEYTASCKGRCNIKPVAVIKADRKGGILIKTPIVAYKVNFDGRQSSADADGKIKSFKWTINGLAIPATASEGSDRKALALQKDAGFQALLALQGNDRAVLTAAFQRAGTYRVTLTVTDNLKAEASSSVDIVVTDPANPAAGLSANVTSGKKPLTVSFTGTGTDPNVSGRLFYSLNFGDATSPATNLPNPPPGGDIDFYQVGASKTFNPAAHVYSQAGTYHAVLKVIDHYYGEGVAKLDITVSE